MTGTGLADRQADTLADRLSRCYASAVHDVLRGLGHDNCLLPHEIRPLLPGRGVLAGEIWTVGGHIDRTRSAHDTLLTWTGVLSKAPPGKVVICQPNNREVALMGELSAAALQLKGVRGYIVDVGCRDVAMIEQIGFPVWCSFFTPSDIVSRWMPDRFGEPVTIGTVTVCSGDYVIADRDGIVILPAAMAAEVIAKAEAVIGTEGEVRRHILAGMDPQEAYRRHGKF
ncbi:RraA family protein [Ferrovibrio xuzhouensis]|uniref:Putative 4-hydroxy-4-methyl-2-oxoglutarate aldolase n=1 Tax=Ferrovibrio xuzhouensis TaxID=1576914 RepID=A0ABV7VCT1_9PROT